MRDPARRDKRMAGYSLIELLVVIAIIAIMAAVAVPNVMAYMRNYTIESAAKSVVSEMNTARYRAIMKNTNSGVLFVVRDQSTYQWVILDDQRPQDGQPPPVPPGPAPTMDSVALDTLLTSTADWAVAQRGIPQTLPVGVVFADPNGTATDPAISYTRFGGACDPGASQCGSAVTGFSGPSLITNTPSGSTILINQPSTSLSRQLAIGPGGRVRIVR